MHGYDTEEQARADAAEMIERGRETWELGANARQVRADYLAAALIDAGIELGAYDAQIIGWLSGWEPETVQVIIRWIEQAHHA